MNNAASHQIEIKVEPSDIDIMDHANNIVYLRWVQEAAVSHWQSAASAEARSSLLWVVARHEIDYLRSAVLADTVIAKTWVGSATKRHFERFTEIRRKTDNKILAKVRTLWTPVDAKTKRPTLPDPSVFAGFSLTHPQ